MVAARVRVDFRRAPEFTHPDDQRAVEQAAIVQVFEKNRQCLVGNWQVILFDDRVHSRIVKAMRVPTAARGALAADVAGEVASNASRHA